MINKNFLLISIIILVSISCSDDDSDDNNGSVDYKQEMRLFVQGISSYAKSQKSDFIIIPQNGQEICTIDGDNNGLPATTYLRAIDGVGREDLFYGYHNDNETTPVDEKEYLIDFLDICESNNVEVLTTDYCWTHSKMDDSYAQNESKGYISFAAPERELNVIPDYPAILHNENIEDITTLGFAKNFLYIINPEKYNSKTSFIQALSRTNYDILIIDLYFEEIEFTPVEINTLKTKQNGVSRLVIAYMSIGEAEDYRYYWNEDWNANQPAWLEGENPDWEGNFKVKYWMESWQQIIFGTDNAYLDKIVSAGFDGVYLDIIDAFEYFE